MKMWRNNKTLVKTAVLLAFVGLVNLLFLYSVSESHSSKTKKDDCSTTLLGKGNELNTVCCSAGYQLA